MHRGYVKLWRKSTDNGLIRNCEAWTVWTYILLKASHRHHTQLVGSQLVDLKPGQVLVGRKALAERLGLTERKIRTSLDLLRKMKNVTIKTTNKYSLITVANWALYQCDDQQGDQQNANERPANDQQTTTNKNEKNEKNKEKPSVSFVETDMSFRLAKYLFNCIRKNKPDFKTPNLQTWAKHVDWMLRVDNRDAEEIREVIKWTQEQNVQDHNGFCWAFNVLSTQKLRKQYDQLAMRMSAACDAETDNEYIPLSKVVGA